MFSLDFIFITITLLVLLVIAIKIGSPKVAIPSIFIYIFFIIINAINVGPSIDLEKNEVDESKAVQNLEETDIDVNNNQEENQNSLAKKDNKKQDVKKTRSSLDQNISLKKKKVIEEKIKKPKIKKNDQQNLSTEVEKNKFLNNLITLKDIKICKNIKNRSPIGIGEVFPNSIDSLYCYTKIENLGKKMEVRHVWYYENQIMTQVRYNVKKSNVYRSWTKKTISSFQIGNWRVEVQDRNGTIIGSKRFKIIQSS